MCLVKRELAGSSVKIDVHSDNTYEEVDIILKTPREIKHTMRVITKYIGSISGKIAGLNPKKVNL